MLRVVHSKNEECLELEKLIRETAKRYSTPMEYLSFLKTQGFVKLECMIIDSALKGFPLENLYRTLLILEHHYFIIIQQLYEDLTNLFLNQ